jgi:hypothetical protein
MKYTRLQVLYRLGNRVLCRPSVAFVAQWVDVVTDNDTGLEFLDLTRVQFAFIDLGVRA